MEGSPTKTFHKVIRVPKEHSAFVYFTLEANEGICFYSTVESSLGTGYRDIDIRGHHSTLLVCEVVLAGLAGIMPTEVLLDETITD